MLSCPVCCEDASLPLCTLTAMPLIGCRFAQSRAEALDAERGTLDLVLCPACSHIYNRAFESERVSYAPGYENALGFSPRHRAHSGETVERLIRRYGLRGKSVVEVGCGSADFLSLLCTEGGNHGAGYDPTQAGRVSQAGDGSITIVAKTFSSAGQSAVDFVCSQHVLEHLAELGSMLRQARAILKQDGNGYFEIPNGLAIFRDLDIWDLTYEHVSYFSPTSLRRALSDAGFSVLWLGTTFGGQYLYAEVGAGGAAAAVPSAPAECGDFCSGFRAAFAKVTGHWRDRIANAVESGHRTVLWGAGTKAVSFLNLLGIGADDGIEYVVDINPRKAGRFLPGTAQKIVSPEYLHDYRPDIVAVMNPEYEAEVQSMLDSMNLPCNLVTVSSESMQGGWM